MLEFSTFPTDLLRVTASGNVSILVSDDFTGGTELVVDSVGDLYASSVQQAVGLSIEKYSPTGSSLGGFAGTDLVSQLEIANDVIHTDTGSQLATAGNVIGSFTIGPNSHWFTVDGFGNILFGEDVGILDPQSLTLEDPSGALQAAGELPVRAEQADF